MFLWMANTLFHVFIYIYIFLHISTCTLYSYHLFSVSFDVYSLVGPWHNGLKISGHCRCGRRGGWLWGSHCLLMPSRCPSFSYFGQRAEWGVWWERKQRKPRHDESRLHTRGLGMLCLSVHVVERYWGQSQFPVTQHSDHNQRKDSWYILRYLYRLYPYDPSGAMIIYNSWFQLTWVTSVQWLIFGQNMIFFSYPLFPPFPSPLYP